MRGLSQTEEDWFTGVHAHEPRIQVIRHYVSMVCKEFVKPQLRHEHAQPRDWIHRGHIRTAMTMHCVRACRVHASSSLT